MIRVLYSFLFLSCFVNAEESVCEGERLYIGKNHTTISDMIIVLEFDGEPSHGIHTVRFQSSPGKWDLISKWIEMPKSSKVKIDSITLKKDKCAVPHSGKWSVCWIKITTAKYTYNKKEFAFEVSAAPESNSLGCKSPSEFLNTWVY